MQCYLDIGEKLPICYENVSLKHDGNLSKTNLYEQAISNKKYKFERMGPRNSEADASTSSQNILQTIRRVASFFTDRV